MASTETLVGVRDVLSTIASIDASEVAPERTLAELGLDSLATLELIVATEDRFGVLIPDDVWARFRTVGDVVGHLERSAAGLP